MIRGGHSPPAVCLSGAQTSRFHLFGRPNIRRLIAHLSILEIKIYKAIDLREKFAPIGPLFQVSSIFWRDLVRSSDIWPPFVRARLVTEHLQIHSTQVNWGNERLNCPRQGSVNDLTLETAFQVPCTASSHLKVSISSHSRMYSEGPSAYYASHSASSLKPSESGSRPLRDGNSPALLQSHRRADSSRSNPTFPGLFSVFRRHQPLPSSEPTPDHTAIRRAVREDAHLVVQPNSGSNVERMDLLESCAQLCRRYHIDFPSSCKKEDHSTTTRHCIGRS
ncbi:hypothetical protein DFH07DRAFT_443177 [Mycena maculata]|uniref:Uncharacterized protein n=1 Tax=Mycena maculata TaxID=230809 RepID=A0AAD7JCN0_9AGAR|nr:hypothetical protein DFH07DRAFT_443177 [Mycena maculata]